MLNLDLQDSGALVRAGIIKGISNEAYHKSAGVSKSQLDQFAKSPAHYLASLTTPRKETEAMRIGTLFHTLALEPEKANFVVGPNINKNTKEWKAFRAEAEAAGQVVIDEGDNAMLQGMVASIKNHPAASALLSGPGIAEGSCWWYDERSGELCRCRPDFYREGGILVDLKTTEDASLAGFTKSVANFRYAVQAAMYADGVETSTGMPIKAFAFIAVEKQPPFAAQCFQLDFQATEVGRVTYQNLLLDLADCKINGKFPAYSDKVETISLPNWALKGVFE